MPTKNVGDDVIQGYVALLRAFTYLKVKTHISRTHSQIYTRASTKLLLRLHKLALQRSNRIAHSRSTPTARHITGTAALYTLEIMPNPIGRHVEDDPNCVQRDHRKGNHFMQHKTDWDAEDRFELFLLDEGQQKVETKEETRKSHPHPALPRPY